MHLVRGEDLRKAIRRLHGLDRDGDTPAAAAGRAPSRLELHALVGRLVAACYAVAYAHRRKVIHRDLKPANIMLGPFGETFVIDWGLITRYEPAKGDDREPTGEPGFRPGAEADLPPNVAVSGPGTLGYMPPEQILGDPAGVGPASDIFSLGATLYCLLTGHRPFSGPTGAVVREKTLAGDFPPPRRANPSVPRPLEAVCLKAMAHRPEDRYESAKALAEDLERWLADEPVRAYREPAAVRLARWARRHRTAVASAAVLLATATVALAVFGVKVNAARATAEANFRAAADAIQQMLKAAEGPDLAYLPGAEALRNRQAAATIGLLRRLLATRPGDPKARYDLAHALRASAAIGLLSGPSAESEGGLREAIDLLTALVAEHPGSTDYRLELARALIDSGESLRPSRPAEAEAPYGRALEALGPQPDGPGAPAEVRRALAMALLDRGSARCDTGHFAEARADDDRAVAVLARLADDPQALAYDRVLLLHALINRARAARWMGDRPAAEGDLVAAARRARDLMAAQAGNSDAKLALAVARSRLAWVLGDSPARAADASSAIRDALVALVDLTRQFPHNRFYRKELAFALILRGDRQLAERHANLAEKDGDDARRCLAGAAADDAEYQSCLGLASALLGRAALAAGRPGDARSLLHRAVAHHEAVLQLNPDSPEDKAALGQCRKGLDGLDVPRRPATP